MLANFLGVLPILTTPLCVLTFIMCSKSSPIVVFALDLMSTYEGEHTIFGLLLAYFLKNISIDDMILAWQFFFRPLMT
jgi:hypothetical protein